MRVTPGSPGGDEEPGAGRPRSTVEIALGYGYEPTTTANHLMRALAREAHVSAVGAGHGADAPAAPVEGLLWVESGVPWLPSVELLEQVTSGAWIIDTHRGIRWRRHLAQAFDMTFVAQFDAVAPFRAAGIAVEWLPLAAPADLCAPGPDLADRPYDVALVGQVRPGSHRAAVVAALSERFAMAPRRGFVPPAEMMELYRQSRVVVNIPVARDLNMRTFEAAGARSLLVTGPATMLDRVLPRGSYLEVERRHPPAWVAAVDRALRDPDAQSRADEAHASVIARHTYDNRAARVLEALPRVSKRRIEGEARASGLAAGYARWGCVGEIRRLPLGAGPRARWALTALAWAAVMEANRARWRAAAALAARR